MQSINLVVSIIGIIGTLSTIFFAYLAIRRSVKEEDHKEGIKEATIESDICYIKECLKRLEEHLDKVETRYNDIGERIVKVEVALENLKN